MRNESEDSYWNCLWWEAQTTRCLSAPPSDPDFLRVLRARNAEGFESEAVCVDPKRYDLLLRRAKPEETLVEARRVSNVQIDLWTWL